ncbi:serine/threonine protein kinase [Brevundimonas vesicularis]|uniref:serine/threonine protein kinase n=1 Tax=Brevundimonas vesicularis TaxID=41276 RepID=UPI0038D512BE
MDSVKAEQLFVRLQGQLIDGWQIKRLIDHGKSAAVFFAERDGAAAAVKIFDADLIERYGDEAQIGRIQRELALIGKTHPNVVSIFGGGCDKSQSLYYVIMEFVEGDNLRKCLKKLDRSHIPNVMAQLAAAAIHLEELGLVHRDIKPENISVSPDLERIVLLDLGVIRPVGLSDLTDPDGIRAFIGTLQYSSPEFLLRGEETTVEGYRALTFYQMGAVLHDLIMGEPIFDDFKEPYAVMVNAVQHERPLIEGDGIDSHWINLANRCLLKRPELRLKLVSWKDFTPTTTGTATSAKERLSATMATIRAVGEDAQPVAKSVTESQLAREIVLGLRTAASGLRATIPGLPPYEAVEVEGENIGVTFHMQQPNGPFSRGLHIATFIEVLDVTEQVVRCCSTTTIGDDAGQVRKAWFSGVVDQSLIASAFEEYLAAAIEWFLRTAPALVATSVAEWEGE